MGLSSLTQVKGSVARALSSIYTPRFSSLKAAMESTWAQLGVLYAFDIDGYHEGSTEGGGRFVLGTGQHNGMTFISLDRSFPSDWSDDSSVLEWYSTGTSSSGFLRKLSGELTSSEAGLINDDISDVVMPQLIESLWNLCASESLHCEMTSYEYIVEDWRAGGSSGRSLIQVPSNLSLSLNKGCKFRRSPYGDTVPQFSRVIEFNQKEKVTVKGVLEVDGGYTGDELDYNEHNHCVFVYQSDDITIEEVLAYNAMGDSLGISGLNNSEGGLSNRVRVSKATLGFSGRKSLVVEGTKDSWMGDVVLDNGAANCLDYEPFSVDNDEQVMSISIDNLTCYSGTDFTTGTGYDRARVSTLHIKNWIIVPNPSETNSPVFSYATTAKVDKLTVDARKAAALTGNLVVLQQGARWSVDVLEILVHDNYTGRAINITTSQADSPASLTSNTIDISGNGDTKIFNQGILLCDKLTLHGNKSGQNRVEAQSTSRKCITDINTLIAYNPTSSTALVDMLTIGSTYPTLQRIGHIAVYDSSSTDPLNGVVRCYLSALQEHVNIGGISISGQAPLNITVNATGGVQFYRTTGGFGTVSDYVLGGSLTTPEARIPAKLGSTCKTSLGALFIKTADDTLNTGWTQIT